MARVDLKYVVTGTSRGTKNFSSQQRFSRMVAWA